jgi:hypothetical protein
LRGHWKIKRAFVQARILMRTLKRRERRAPIPKGLCHSAQRWRAATTLGEPAKWETTLKELWQFMAAAMQPLQG